MTRLFSAAGVDYGQWRALARAYTLIDYAAILGAYGHAASVKAARHLLYYVLTWTIIGSGGAFYILMFSDAWLSATIMTTTTAMLVAFIVLAQAGTLVAPDDYEIVGFRPITSRTYFAVRATALLLQTAEMALFTGYLPVVAYLARSGGSWRQALAAVAAVVVAAVTTTLGVTAAYGWLLKWIRPAALTRFVTFSGVLMLLGLMGMNAAFFMGVVHFGDAGITFKDTVSLPRHFWILWYPGTWFAAYVELARGGAGAIAWTAAGLSVAAMGALAVTLGDRLTAGYAVSVAQASTQTQPVVRESGGRWTALRHEARAVALIARAQFRGDLTFQMGVVMMFVMPAIFLGAGWFVDAGTDPFVDRTHVGSIFLLTIFAAPSGFLQTFASSPVHQASWLFFTTPADRIRLITATRDIAAVCLIAPITLAIAALMWFSYHHLGHAVLQALFVGALGYVNLQLAVLFRPSLPFSRPVATGKHPTLPAGIGVIPMLTGSALFIVGGLLAFRSLLSFAITALVIGATIVALEVWTRRRLVKVGRTLMYEG
jgi:hypothetical protein